MMAEDRDQGSGISAAAEASAKGGDRKYRKKPVMVQAFRWFGDPPSGLPDWALPHCIQDAARCYVETLNGQTTAENGDWIIRGPAGDVWPCKADIFEATYEPFGWISGVSMIADERRRQVDEEGHSAERDDLHIEGELADAGAVFAATCPIFRNLGQRFHQVWPQEWPFKKDLHPRMRQLVIAGALVAAEIDRLLRLQAPEAAGPVDKPGLEWEG